MLPHTPEETLYSYLRRHYEKVSDKQARQLTEREASSQEDRDHDSVPAELSRR